MKKLELILIGLLVMGIMYAGFYAGMEVKGSQIEYEKGIKQSREFNYVVYYTKDSTEQVFNAEGDGMCGDFIIRKKDRGRWTPLKSGTYYQVVPIDSVKN